MKSYQFRIIKDAESYPEKYFIQYKSILFWRWLKYKPTRNRTDPRRIINSVAISNRDDDNRYSFKEDLLASFEKTEGQAKKAKKLAIETAIKYFEAKLKKEKYPGRYFVEETKVITADKEKIKINTILEKTKIVKQKKEYETIITQDEQWQNDYKVALKELG